MVARRIDNGGEQPEYVGALQDVTQRKRAEDALRAARSDLAQAEPAMSLGVLTASIAHEVNQPLAGIITNANTCLRMLASSPPNIDGARATAWRTIRDGHRALDVVARLRALFAKGDVSAESVDLNQVVREVITLAAPDLHNVAIRLELNDELPPAAGDRVQLQQVLMNLLINAAEATGAAGHRAKDVLIRTQRGADDSAAVTVSDVGIGFDPESVERMFAPFHSTKPRGMGIGLAISRSIIESHQGRLWAELNEGPGATFGFSIPNTRSIQQAAPEA
jgi:C4-dicarboxylate-specific signal transduction histidine kinase